MKLMLPLVSLVMLVLLSGIGFAQPDAPATAALSKIEILPNETTDGGTVGLRITLDNVAEKDIDVNVTAEPAAAISNLPLVVRIPRGQQQSLPGTQIKTVRRDIDKNQPVTITASYGGKTAPAVLTITPAGTTRTVVDQDGTFQWFIGARALTNSGEGDSAASGLIGFRELHGSRQISATFSNVTSDTITVENDTFGTQLLNPATEARGVTFRYSALVNAENSSNTATAWGYYSRLGTMFANWEGTITNDDDSTEKVTVNGPLISASVGLQFVSRVYEQQVEGATRHHWFGAEIGVTDRLFIGNLTDEDNFREQVFGTTKTHFLGAEGRFYAHLGTIEPFLRLTYFPKSDERIVGFTGMQAAIGIDVLNVFASNKEGGTTGAGPEGGLSPARRQSAF